ncbi:nicotinamide mononucleotide transporter [Spiroplasma mirum]|uniref:nicotinamide mononucleotide transporter n=1 Tax=Spiroplasma mirum TaxID=2144 RepID=UPI0038B5C69B
MSNFFWGTINVIIYGLFAFAWGYNGTAQLNIFFFLPFQIIGWYHWQKRIGVWETEVKMWEWRWYYVLVGAIIIGIIISVIFYFEIPWLLKLITGQYDYDNQVAPHLLDTLNTGLSIIVLIMVIQGAYNIIDKELALVYATPDLMHDLWYVNQYNIINHLHRLDAVTMIPYNEMHAFINVATQYSMQVNNLILPFSIMIGLGCTRNFFIAYGQRNSQKMKEIAGNGFATTTIFSIIVAFVIFCIIFT